MLLVVLPLASVMQSTGIMLALGIFFFIPASSKNPEAAARYLNWMVKYENYHFIQTGPEGITHIIDSDGVIKLDPSAQKDPSWIMNSNKSISQGNKSVDNFSLKNRFSEV